MKNKKGFINWILLSVIAITIIIIITLANIGQISIFGKKFYLISPQFQNQFTFLLWFAWFIIIQALWIYLIIKLFSWTKQLLTFSKPKVEFAIRYVKGIFK